MSQVHLHRTFHALPPPSTRFPKLTSNCSSYLSLLQTKGKVLLCNACGIRWKRKNRTTDKRRLKPGPKRSRQCSTTTCPSPNYMSSFRPVVQPNMDVMFYKQSLPGMYSPNGSNLSSSSTITDPRLETASMGAKRYYQQQHSTEEYRRPCSKMNVHSLVSPTNAHPRSSPDSTTFSKKKHARHSSPISIKNLLNCADEDGSNTAYSSSAYRALRC